LAQCRRCALDLRDFAELPDLLDEADANGMLRANTGERPDGRSVRAMLDSVSGARARKRRNVALLTAAAATLLVVLTAVVAVNAASPSDPVAASSSTPLAPDPSYVAKGAPDGAGAIARTDPATGVNARLAASPEPWGTSVEVEVKGVKGPTRCELIAKSRTGESMVIGSWLVTASGAGKDPVTIRAAVGMRWHDIAEFTIRDTKEGATLVRLPNS
jgi:hypothetical protein